MNHDYNKFSIFNNKNHKQYCFLALKQHHSIKIPNTIVLGLKFNLLGKNHVLYCFTREISCLNYDKSGFNSVSIKFQTHFNPVFADKSGKSCHNQQIIEKTNHNHVFMIVISIPIMSRILCSLKNVITPTFIGYLKVSS